MDTRADFQRLLEDMDKVIAAKRQELSELDERLDTARSQLSEKEAQELRGADEDDQAGGVRQPAARGRSPATGGESSDELIGEQRRLYEQQLDRLGEELTELDSINQELVRENKELRVELDSSKSLAERLKAKAHMLAESLEEVQSANLELNLRLARAESDVQMQEKLLKKSHDQDEVLMDAFNDKLDSLKKAIEWRDDEIRRLRSENQFTLESFGIRLDGIDDKTEISQSHTSNHNHKQAQKSPSNNSSNTSGEQQQQQQHMSMPLGGLIDSGKKRRVIEIASAFKEKDSQIELLKSQLLQATKDLERNANLLEMLTSDHDRQVATTTSPSGQLTVGGLKQQQQQLADQELIAKYRILEGELEAKDKQLHSVEFRNRHFEMTLPSLIANLIESLASNNLKSGRQEEELRRELVELLKRLLAELRSSAFLLDNIEYLKGVNDRKDAQIASLVQELNQLDAKLSYYLQPREAGDELKHEFHSDTQDSNRQTSINRKTRASMEEIESFSKQRAVNHSSGRHQLNDGSRLLDSNNYSSNNTSRSYVNKPAANQQAGGECQVADKGDGNRRATRLADKKSGQRVAFDDQALARARVLVDDSVSVSSADKRQPLAGQQRGSGEISTTIDGLAALKTWNSVSQAKTSEWNQSRGHQSVSESESERSIRRPATTTTTTATTTISSAKQLTKSSQRPLGFRQADLSSRRSSPNGGHANTTTATTTPNAIDTALNLQSRLRQLENENELLELAMKEILLSIKWSDAQCSTILIDCPSLERLCQLIEARFLARSRTLEAPPSGQEFAHQAASSSNLFQMIVLKSELDLLRGQNEQLRSDLKLQRRDYVKAIGRQQQQPLIKETSAVEMNSTRDTCCESESQTEPVVVNLAAPVERPRGWIVISGGGGNSELDSHEQIECQQCTRLTATTNHLLQCIVRLETRVNLSDETYLSRLISLHRLIRMLEQDLSVRERLLSESRRECHSMSQQKLMLESRLQLIESQVTSCVCRSPAGNNKAAALKVYTAAKNGNGDSIESLTIRSGAESNVAYQQQVAARGARMTISLLQSIIGCLQARLDYKDERLQQLERLMTARSDLACSQSSSSRSPSVSPNSQAPSASPRSNGAAASLVKVANDSAEPTSVEV